MFRAVEIFSAMCQSFEVFTAILLQVQVFWDVTLSEVDQANHSVRSTCQSRMHSVLLKYRESLTEWLTQNLRRRNLQCHIVIILEV